MSVGVFKFLISVFFANAIRILRFIPNNDPIMGMMLPFSKQEKVYVSVLFPIVTMVSFDLLTSGLGLWTLITAATYGCLGLSFYFAYKKMKKVDMKRYLGSGVIGVLIFDLVTGVIAAPFMFGMSFPQAFIGQIPFTLLHLTTVTGYILIITPLLDKHILKNKNLDDTKILTLLFKRSFA